jgi:hypothetical protein
MIEYILTGLNFLIFVATSYMFYNIVKLNTKYRDVIFKFENETNKIASIELSIKRMEVDFIEKFDYTLRKLQSRMAMRKKREEDEEEEQNLKSPIVGI